MHDVVFNGKMDRQLASKQMGGLTDDLDRTIRQQMPDWLFWHLQGKINVKIFHEFGHVLVWSFQDRG